MNIKLSQDFILDQLPALDPSCFSDIPVGTVFECGGGRFLKTFTGGAANAIKFDRNIPSSWVWFTAADKVYASSKVGSQSTYGKLEIGDTVLINSVLYILFHKDLFGRYNDYQFHSLMNT